MIIGDINTIMMMKKTSPLPTGFTLLNYLESNGTQYLNTGLKVNNGTPFKISFQIITSSNPPTSISNGCFGARGNNTGYGIGYFRYNNVNYLGIYHNGMSGSAINASNIGENELYGHDISLDVRANGDLYINGSYLRTITFNSHTATSNSYLFTWNYTSATKNFTWRIYDFEIPNSCHLIPAMRDADSVVGMYDVEQNVFRTNQGTGTFTYG